MADCNLLTRSISPDCENPMVPGVGKRAWIYPLSVWQAAAKVLDNTDTNLITSFVLASGDTGIYLDVPSGVAIEPSYTANVGTFGTTFLHQVILRVFKNNLKIKQQVEKLNRGEFVVIVENNYKGDDDDVAFEVYGYTAGLRASEAGRTVNDVDSLGSYTMTLASQETQPEPRLPLSYLDTDYATSLAALNASVTATQA